MTSDIPGVRRDHASVLRDPEHVLGLTEAIRDRAAAIVHLVRHRERVFEAFSRLLELRRELVPALLRVRDASPRVRVVRRERFHLLHREPRGLELRLALAHDVPRVVAFGFQRRDFAQSLVRDVPRVVALLQKLIHLAVVRFSLFPRGDELVVARLDHPARFVALSKQRLQLRVALGDGRFRVFAFALQRAQLFGKVRLHLVARVRELRVALLHHPARFVALAHDLVEDVVVVVHAPFRFLKRRVALADHRSRFVALAREPLDAAVRVRRFRPRVLDREFRALELRVSVVHHVPRFVSLRERLLQLRVAFVNDRARFVALAKQDFHAVAPLHALKRPGDAVKRALQIVIALEDDPARFVAFFHRAGEFIVALKHDVPRLIALFNRDLRVRLELGHAFVRAAFQIFNRRALVRDHILTDFIALRREPFELRVLLVDDRARLVALAFERLEFCLDLLVRRRARDRPARARDFLLEPLVPLVHQRARFVPLRGDLLEFIFALSHDVPRVVSLLLELRHACVRAAFQVFDRRALVPSRGDLQLFVFVARRRARFVAFEEQSLELRVLLVHDRARLVALAFQRLELLLRLLVRRRARGRAQRARDFVLKLLVAFAHHPARFIALLGRLLQLLPSDAVLRGDARKRLARARDFLLELLIPLEHQRACFVALLDRGLNFGLELRHAVVGATFQVLNRLALVARGSLTRGHLLHRLPRGLELRVALVHDVPRFIALFRDRLELYVLFVDNCARLVAFA
eukprot:31449-Pelagococcus_subviridis.AAC.2